MSQEINLTLPAIDETLIANITTLQTETAATESAAFAALREKYGPMARHNGYIKIAYFERSDSNYSQELEKHYDRDGKRVRALLADDSFGRQHDDRNRGACTGSRLYLTEHGDWVRIVRRGSWSNWQGEAHQWGCGITARPNEWDGDNEQPGGSVAILDDATVTAKYDLADVIQELSKSLATMATKLPERYGKLQQRTALASQLLAALK